ncbi:hypothetical protein JW911_01030 [Candidatus Peregrinibacteria bacterium]|nr:hypothetical protein [Candidatus Peregrinibacteria bacterium]
MKEKGPEIKKSKLRKVAEDASIILGIFGIMSIIAIGVGKVTRAVDPPEDMYRISVKTKEPLKKGDPPEMQIKLIKQCIEAIVHPAPAPFTQTFYKDCE